MSPLRRIFKSKLDSNALLIAVKILKSRKI